MLGVCPTYIMWTNSFLKIPPKKKIQFSSWQFCVYLRADSTLECPITKTAQVQRNVKDINKIKARAKRKDE
jgi:hypothetical protein